MFSCIVLLCFLVCACCAEGLPYVLYDESNTAHSGDGGFSLCLGTQPSDILRNSLLMCRELSYQFCVNSSLIGSVLHVDSATARHFVASLNEPTPANIEQLAWLVDSALVLLYQTFSATGNANIDCAHEWRSWVCSRAFQKAASNNGVPLPLCASTCERAESACNANLQCSARSVATDMCTDFYRDSAAACHSSSVSATGGGGGVNTQSVPVFRDPQHYYTSGAATTTRRQSLAVVVFCFAAQFALR